jgi:hypothetical protein
MAVTINKISSFVATQAELKAWNDYYIKRYNERKDSPDRPSNDGLVNPIKSKG